MSDDKAINGSRGWTILLSTVLAGTIGSGGGVFIYMQNLGADQLQQMARPDPATGSELRQIRKNLQRHLDNHPDIVNQFDRRITRLEIRLETIIKNQNRILERLN